MFRDDYIKDGRGITEYRLNLTLDETRHLWKTLDDQVARQLYLDLDYVNNGCTQVVFDGLYDLMRMRSDIQIDEVIPAFRNHHTGTDIGIELHAQIFI